MGGYDQLKTDSLMEQMKVYLATDAGKEITKKTGLVYEFRIAPKKIEVDEFVYTVDLKKGEVKKGAYEGGKPDASFSSKDDDFYKIATGSMNAQMAFMRGALKLKGSISAAQKFSPDLFPKPSKIFWVLPVVHEWRPSHCEEPVTTLEPVEAILVSSTEKQQSGNRI